MINQKVKSDIEILKEKLPYIEKTWDGKECVLKLKEAKYNWKQMEWWAFYFEYQIFSLLKKDFEIPGEKINNVKFDLKRNINWDIKATAIKTHNNNIILNDVEAMNESINKYKYHGEIIGLCDVEYNDINRSFQKWHTELKGGYSKYELERIERTSISRYRKTKAILEEIILLILDKNSITKLSIMQQGRNSNGKPRKEKYLLDLEMIEKFNFVQIMI